MSEELLSEEYQHIFQLLRKLRPPPTTGIKKIVDTAYQECAACARQTYVGDFKVYDSGVLPMVLIPLCKYCQSSHKDSARLVCYRCKTVIGWIDPHIDKDKFVFEKKHSYHIQACPVCSPGLDKSDIIEKIIYLRQIKKTYQ